MDIELLRTHPLYIEEFKYSSRCAVCPICKGQGVRTDTQCVRRVSSVRAL